MARSFYYPVCTVIYTYLIHLESSVVCVAAAVRPTSVRAVEQVHSAPFVLSHFVLNGSSANSAPMLYAANQQADIVYDLIFRSLHIVFVLNWNNYLYKQKVFQVEVHGYIRKVYVSDKKCINFASTYKSSTLTDRLNKKYILLSKENTD